MHTRSAIALFMLFGSASFLAPCPAPAQALDPMQSDNQSVALQEGVPPFPQDGVCSRTSVAALRACRSEVEDTYWIDTGKCINLEDDGERAQCLQAAEEARIEARARCLEQFHARGEVCEAIGEDAYDPETDPEDFLDPEDAAADPNPWFPLVPGTRWVYEGGDEGVEVTVDGETVEILGVSCFVVRDVVRESGVVIEDTTDWYAVDEDHNVWYFGEASQSFEDGQLVSLDGSWKAGEDGARPGIVMKGEPAVGDVYRQEFLLGDAEDIGAILSLTGDEDVPAASCDGHCVVTEDTTPMEPGHVENKHYAPGVGLILEVNPETGERVELIEYETPLQPRAAGVRSEATTGGADFDIYPNPFRTGVSIRIVLPARAILTAEVFDTAGRRVRALTAGVEMPPGTSILRWDGRDDAGRSLATGMYFIRMRAGEEIRTRSLVLAPRSDSR